MPSVPPVKDRRVQELRAQAQALRDELLDPTKQFTPDEVKQKGDAIASLEQRAALAAGFTPEAEIERQGGDAELREVESPEGQEPPRRTIVAQIDALNKRAKQEFGGVAAFARAAMKPNAILTDRQRQVLADAKTLTRTIVGTTSDASGAEFLLPLQQEESIFRVDNRVQGILGRARQYNPRGRTLRIPHLVQTDGTENRPLSSIADVGIVGEASEKPVREPTFAQRLMTVYKYAAISQSSDEMLEDDMTGELQPAILEAVGGEVLNQIDFDVTIAGSGSSMPTAALHTSGNAALVKVSRTTAGRIKFADAVNMYVRHTHGPKSFWMVSRRAIGELFSFEVSTGSGATFLANLAQNPAGTPLLGYPIVVCDFLNTLGTEGDFALVNPDFYAVGLRKALTIESSIHYAFRDDVTTWRFVARAGGIPIPTSTYAYRSVSSSKVDEHSPFVVLDDVVAS